MNRVVSTAVFGDQSGDAIANQRSSNSPIVTSGPLCCPAATSTSSCVSFSSASRLVAADALS